MAINLSVSRLGSVIAGWVTPGLLENHSLGFAFMVGVIVCIFSLACAFGLVIIDLYADKVDKTEAARVSDEDKFKFKDLLYMGKMFWLIAANCVLIYGTIFPFQQVST